tara:strand:+ start:292 stop:1665 length:1374 start_codon:yes stop_codon:yes gene_type:complete
MAIKDFLDKTSFSDRKSVMDLYSNGVRKAMKFNAYGDETVFEAIILSAPIYLIDADISNGNKAIEAGESGKMSKFAFKARIITNPSPHDYLPDPCDANVASNPSKAVRLINLHTTFFSSDDYTRTSNLLPKVGDIVYVQLDENVFSFNLQYGTFLGVKTNSTSETDFSGECKSTMAEFYSKPVEKILPSEAGDDRSSFGTKPSKPAPDPGAYPPNDWSPVELPNKSKIWPPPKHLKTTNVNLILIYPSDRVQTQDFVLDHAWYGLRRCYYEKNNYKWASAYPKETIFLVAKQNSQSWSSIKSDIESLQKTYGLGSFLKVTVMGHGTGLEGFINALAQKDIEFTPPIKFLSDPSPTTRSIKTFEANSISGAEYRDNFRYIVTNYNDENYASQPWYKENMEKLISLVGHVTKVPLETKNDKCIGSPRPPRYNYPDSIEPCHSFILKKTLQLIISSYNFN